VTDLIHGGGDLPVDIVISLLLAFYWGERTTLWSIQEEDAAQVRYVTEDGQETISSRFADVPLPHGAGSFLAEHQRALLAEKSECAGCEFFGPCGGYFKWPDREYSCAGVKTLFRTLKGASVELQADVNAAVEVQGAKRP
jgi:hypothetical protein